VKVSICPAGIMVGIELMVTKGVINWLMLISMVSGFEVQAFRVALTMYFPESLSSTLVLVGLDKVELKLFAPVHE